MKTMLTTITGIGSVTPFGPLKGLISESTVEPSAITAWKRDAVQRAYLVPSFQPASIVPGVKTRRLDRLSAWALVAASLALQDAGIDLDKSDRSRVAVVFATGLGCIELTESFFQSAAKNGWGGTDPITFPETLANSAPGHVALFHGLRGPNITVSSQHFGAENALLTSASLLRHGQADFVIVMAGDALTQTLYEWYETANLLSPACKSAEALASGFMPSEGLVALVMEPEGNRSVRSYAHLHGGRWATGGDAIASVRQMLDGSVPQRVLCAGDGAPCATNDTIEIARAIVGAGAAIIPAEEIALGLTDAGALFHLVLALSKRPERGDAIMLSTAANGGYAALRLELL